MLDKNVKEEVELVHHKDNEIKIRALGEQKLKHEHPDVHPALLIFIRNHNWHPRPDPYCFICNGTGLLLKATHKVSNIEYHGVISIDPVKFRDEPNIMQQKQTCPCVWPKFDRRFDAIIQLQFDDEVDEGEYSFNREHAQQISNMLNFRKWKTIWIVCGEGLSRSPAIANALERYLNYSGIIHGMNITNPYVEKIMNEFLEELAGKVNKC